MTEHYWQSNGAALYVGDCIEVMRTLPDGCVQCVVTSPPYWGLRSYLSDDHDDKSMELGSEATPAEYLENMVAVFAEVKRVLRDDGTLWLNMGDSYAGAPSGSFDSGNRGKGQEGGEFRANKAFNTAIGSLKPKDLCGMPWRLAFALQADGWYLRSDIIWHKPNPMPESCTDRPTKSHEYVFLLSKSARYYYDADAVREPHSSWDGVTRDSYKGGKGDERTGLNLSPQGAVLPSGRKEAHSTGTRSGANLSSAYAGGPPGHAGGRNKRSVWTVTTKPYSGAHFACYPPELITPCILAGCPEGGIVLDPFFGSGTTGMVAEQCGRAWFGIELNPDYGSLIDGRTAQRGLFV